MLAAASCWPSCGSPATPSYQVLPWLYIWFFRGTPVYVQIILWANIGVLYHSFVFGLPLTGFAIGQ